ncbi:MAG: sigma-54 dependent transcriptional regulator [Thermodesulfobacteriota bacterium]
MDDDADMLVMLTRLLRRKCDCQVEAARSGDRALALLPEWRPDVVVTDIKMPGLDGMELLARVKAFSPATSVIVMTGYGNVDLAVQALKKGAYDFIEKPFDQERIVHSLGRCLERVRLLRKNQQLQDLLAGKSSFSGFQGRSARMQEVFALIRKVADTDVTVLIRGESGTGKELAARALHAMSRRAGRPMVTVNCPALPEQILESELFGYARGAFTGALQDKKGLFLEADGSTLLLDEIGDLPLPLQTKLLRVLQEKEIMPLGQTRSLAVDVRVVASTNQDLETKISQGLFREDLFYRLNVVTMEMPPLRERPEDIPLLARHFLEEYAAEYDRGALALAPETEQLLLQRPWPGNVRELQNVVKRAVLLASGPAVMPADLGAAPAVGRSNGHPALPPLHHLDYNSAKQEVLARFTRDYLAEALRRQQGNVTAAAQASGIGRQAFQRLLRRFGLAAESFRNGHTPAAG